jgi:hypothetical protein
MKSDIGVDKALRVSTRRAFYLLTISKVKSSILSGGKENLSASAWKTDTPFFTARKQRSRSIQHFSPQYIVRREHGQARLV